jgi:hypothetical protein
MLDGGGILWQCLPPMSASSHPTDEGEAVSTPGMHRLPSRTRKAEIFLGILLGVILGTLLLTATSYAALIVSDAHGASNTPAPAPTRTARAGITP